MLRTFLIINLFLLCQNAMSADKKVLNKVMYVKNLFSLVHRNPSTHSNSLTTIECGHPVKTYKMVSKRNTTRVKFNREWRLVKVGSYEGYINGVQLSSRKVECFQDKFPKFFDSLDIEINDMFYWGKLHDQYVTGKSKAN